MRQLWSSLASKELAFDPLKTAHNDTGDGVAAFSKVLLRCSSIIFVHSRLLTHSI